MGSSLVNMGEHIGYEPEETPPTQVHASWELTYSGDNDIVFSGASRHDSRETAPQ